MIELHEILNQIRKEFAHKEEVVWVTPNDDNKLIWALLDVLFYADADKRNIYYILLISIGYLVHGSKTNDYRAYFDDILQYADKVQPNKSPSYIELIISMTIYLTSKEVELKEINQKARKIIEKFSGEIVVESDEALYIACTALFDGYKDSILQYM